MTTLETPPEAHHHHHTDRCPATDGEPPPGCVHSTPPVFKALWLRIVLFLPAFVGMISLGGLVAAGVMIASGGSWKEVAFDDVLTRHLVPITLVSTTFGILTTLFFWRRIDRRPLPALGLPFHPGVPGEILRGMASAVWLMTLASIPALIFHVGPIRFLTGGLFPFLVSLFVYGVAFVMVALNEELAFRGYILMNLVLKLKPWTAVAVTSILFAAMHVMNPHLSAVAVLNLLLAGVILSLSVLRTGSLWYAVAFHFAWNLYQSVILTLPVSGVRMSGLLDIAVSGPQWLTGGDFGPEGSIATTALLLLASWRMTQGLPVDLKREPQEPPCASGEECPLVPPEIAAAARRGSAGIVSASESSGSGP